MPNVRHIAFELPNRVTRGNVYLILFFPFQPVESSLMQLKFVGYCICSSRDTNRVCISGRGHECTIRTDSRWHRDIRYLSQDGPLFRNVFAIFQRPLGLSLLLPGIQARATQEQLEATTVPGYPTLQGRP